MSNLEQMEDNLSYMKDFRPLNDSERETIEDARRAMKEEQLIACTACRYCVDGCPSNIPIPDIFAVKNAQTLYPTADKGKRDYRVATTDKGKASECIECGQCEGACPQHLPIIELLKDCVSME